MEIAKTVSMRSKDPITDVGCVIVDRNRVIVGTGFNGFETGAQETEELWKRPTKYTHVKHAEINAISHAKLSTKNNNIYVTLFPCVDCMSKIIETDVIDEIYYLDVYCDTKESLRMADLANIKTFHVNLAQF